MTNVVVTGICVSPGNVESRARVVKGTEGMGTIQPGEILVLTDSHPMYAIDVMNASALVCENGGKLSHICIVAMEMGIPCITQAHGATSLISNGQRISIDASKGVVCTDE